MVLKNIYVIFLLTFWHINTSSSSRSFNVRWQNVNCSIVSQAHIGFYNCLIKERPSNRGNYMTVDLQFKQNINTILLDVKISMGLEGRKVLELTHFRSDGCQIFKRRSTNPIITAVTQIMLKSGNYSRECPLKANTTYSLENVYLIPEYFPEFTNDMTILIKLNTFTNKIHLFSANAVAGALKKKKKDIENV